MRRPVRPGPPALDRQGVRPVLRPIITGDDFGFDVRVNSAIVLSFQQGLISHASLMVNLDHFEDACHLVQVHRLQGRIGLHLNLTEGVPLTGDVKGTPLCAGGRFVPPDRLRHYRFLSPSTKRAVASEVTAQIRAARSAGIALTHLDSHNHIHTIPSLARVIAEVARAHGIPRVRPARTCGGERGMVRWLFDDRCNRLLERLQLKRVRHFGSIDDLLAIRQHEGVAAGICYEAMTHPRLSDDGHAVIDAPFGPLAARVRTLQTSSLAEVGGGELSFAEPVG